MKNNKLSAQQHLEFFLGLGGYYLLLLFLTFSPLAELKLAALFVVSVLAMEPPTARLYNNESLFIRSIVASKISLAICLNRFLMFSPSFALHSM
jgi:hypothetical protein